MTGEAIPRRLRSADCETCQTDGRRLLPGARQQISEHRMLHRRVDRRREQYRASKQRAALREFRGMLEGNRVGTLHDIGCDGTYCKQRGCTPIPVYSRPLQVVR